MSESDVQEDIKTKKAFAPWFRDSQGVPSSSNDLSQATAVFAEVSKGSTREADPEKVLMGDEFGHVEGRKDVKRWSLPDIPNRRSVCCNDIHASV